jgi:hypothetical protein
MTFPSNRKWLSLTVLAIITPIGLLATFKLTGIIPEPPTTTEPIEKEAVTLNFNFTWGPDSQKIVQGELHLKISLRWQNETILDKTYECLTIMIEINDDDYWDWEYMGLVFDTNENGYIDTGDVPIALYANNMTQPSALCDDGFLAFAECPPIRGLQTVIFNPDKGYTFQIQFPPGAHWYNYDPLKSLKKGADNPIHICFQEGDLAKVFVKFLFYIPEEM